MKWLPMLLLLAAPVFAIPPAANNNNDDTCDVKVGPAATLLLPYFEVDVSGNSGYLYQPQLITITNKKLKGVWKDVPQYENDFSTWAWE